VPSDRGHGIWSVPRASSGPVRERCADRTALAKAAGLTIGLAIGLPAARAAIIWAVTRQEAPQL